MHMNNILFACIMLCVMGIIDISWSYLQFRKEKINNSIKKKKCRKGSR